MFHISSIAQLRLNHKFNYKKRLFKHLNKEKKTTKNRVKLPHTSSRCHCHSLSLFFAKSISLFLPPAVRPPYSRYV